MPTPHAEEVLSGGCVAVHLRVPSPVPGGCVAIIIAIVGLIPKLLYCTYDTMIIYIYIYIYYIYIRGGDEY